MIKPSRRCSSLWCACLNLCQHASFLHGEPRLRVALAFTGARTYARSPVECPAYLRVPCHGDGSGSPKAKKSPGYGPSLVYPGFRNPGSHPGCDRGLSPPGLQPGFATWPIPGFSRVVLLGVAPTARRPRNFSDLEEKFRYARDSRFRSLTPAARDPRYASQIHDHVSKQGKKRQCILDMHESRLEANTLCSFHE